MQFRHLRYFVEVVNAGSFSRAAAIIHVAQPALSQQISHLEQRMGVSLLQRSARGVQPTEAGEALYREASSILRKLEELPSIVRSSKGDVEGTVSVGLATMLTAKRAGPFIKACNTELPKVALKFTDADSETLKARVAANTLDLAVVFEDEHTALFRRTPLFRQRLFGILHRGLAVEGPTVSLALLASEPLALPSLPNDRRSVIERGFAAAGLTPQIVVECGALSSELSAVRAGVGSTILNTGDLSDVSAGDLGTPVPVEPALHMTCSVVSCGNAPLTQAGEAVRKVLINFMAYQHERMPVAGSEWLS